MEEPRGEIIIYESAEVGARVEVRLEEETVWLDVHQMAELFQRDRSVILKHIHNIYDMGELDQESTCAKFAQVAKDGKIRLMDLYNLDIIIGVGYRVNSRRGTEFRIWATNVLRDHIIKGYTINQRRLTEQAEHYRELQEAVRLIGDVLTQKAAHLLYFIVKNHSFTDGNKRIAAAIFLWFLDANGLLYAANGRKRLGDNALVALTLMIAESKPQHKEVVVKVIVNLINRDNR